MNCPNCQNHCIDSDSFCIKCGFNLAKHKSELVDNAEKICPDCSAKCKAYDPTCLSCGYPFGELKKPLPPPVKPTVNPVIAANKPIEEKSPIHTSSVTTNASSDSNRPLIISLVVVMAIVIVSFLFFRHYNGANVDNPINSEADLKKMKEDSAMQSSNEITIGEQIWMLNNLDVTTFRNGDIIPEAKTDSDWEEKAKNHQPAWCYYNNDPSNGGRYGKLYNWYAVIDSRNLAPEGYHIPNNKEVWDMFSFFGYDQWASTQQSSNLAYTLYNKFLLPNNLGLRYDWGAFSDNPRKDEVTLWTIDGWKDSEDEYHPGKWGIADGFANGPGGDASSKAGMGLFIRCVKGEKPLPSNAISTQNITNNKIEIGSIYGGGIVAYIYNLGDTRYVEGETHGFIMASRETFSPSWYDASIVCDTLNINGETNWMLPNKDELAIIYNNINLLGGYKSGSHGVWCSSQYDDKQAFVCSFDGGGNFVTLPKSYGFFVRAIKYF